MVVILEYEHDPHLRITLNSFPEVEIILVCIDGLEREAKKLFRGRHARHEYDRDGQQSLKDYLWQVNRPSVNENGLTLEAQDAKAALEALRWKRDHPEAIFGLDMTPVFNPMIAVAEIALLEEQLANS